MSTTTEKWTIFGERLKAELERQGMSLRQFSEKTGITLVTACRYVHSQRTPRATEILKAAKALGTTCDYMLGLSDDPHKTRDGWAKAGFHDLPPAQPETHEKRTETHACDLISRQVAIDALGGNEPVGDPSKMDDDDVVKMWERIRIINIINKLPSAQPETHEERTETHACDLISRQAAIDAHYEYCNKHPNASFPVWSLKILEDLPPAQPDLSGYSDKLWQKAYERGRAEALDEIVRCKDCKWFHDIGCAIRIVDDSDKPSENDYCSFAERRTDEAR